MKLEDLTFTRKQADRIIAEAAEREARQYKTEIEEGEKIGYNQLVQIAQEAQIDPKYLKISTKQLIRESGGLEKAAVRAMTKQLKESGSLMLKSFFQAPLTLPTWFRTAAIQNDFPLMSIIGGAMGISTSWLVLADHPEYRIPLLTLGAITNIASGLYEGYRHEKNKLIKEMNGESKDTGAQR
jgi:hypothetical protein